MDGIDAESLFEYDGALFRLYFQPALYLRGSSEIRRDSRLLLLCGLWAGSLLLLLVYK